MFAQNTINPAAVLWRTFFIILGVSVVMVAAPALAGQVTSGNNDVSLTLSGQVNRALLWADDGTADEIFHVDNSNASTRFLLVGRGKLNKDVTLGTQIEVEAVSNPSDGVTIGGGAGGAGLTARKTELFFDHSRYGKLWLGLGDPASNGTSEVDLSGTTVVANANIADMAGNIDFVGGGTDIAGAHDYFDGLDRADRIRYDSPTINNFVLSGSHLGSDLWDVAVRYSGSLGSGIKIAAAGGYVEDAGTNTISGSVSALYKSGLNLTGAYGKQEAPGGGGVDPSFWYAKVGYIKGQDAFSIDLTESSEVFTSVGVAYVRKYNRAGTELYAGLRSHSFDDGTASPPDDIMTMLAGARVKF